MPGFNARPDRVRRALGLEPNILAVSGAMLLLSLGEGLWRKFLPKYLQALGAPIRAIGLFGSIEHFLDGLYQYPGGWLSDTLGRRNALLLFVSVSIIGYALYAGSASWPWTLLALVFALGWSSMASPTLFAVVGDALPPERRAMGFTVQAILRRLPILAAPTLGGIVIARAGLVDGMRTLFIVTIGLGLITLAVVGQVALPRLHGPATNLRGVWRSFPQSLRWLLLSDVFIRTCEGLVDQFSVIYAMNIIGLSAPQFGLLTGLQAATSMLVYIPAAALAGRVGRKPFVLATFLFFSAFPLALASSTTFLAAAGAFVIGGLREIGEPARKALIVDLARTEMRARTVGLYYLIRSVAIAPAAFTGGLLWEQRPSLPFMAAFLFGLVGTAILAAQPRGHSCFLPGAVRGGHAALAHRESWDD